MSAGGRLRVVICDDSRTYSYALKKFLEHDGDIEVVAVYPTAEELLRPAARRPAGPRDDGPRAARASTAWRPPSGSWPASGRCRSWSSAPTCARAASVRPRRWPPARSRRSSRASCDSPTPRASRRARCATACAGWPAPASAPRAGRPRCRPARPGARRARRPRPPRCGPSASPPRRAGPQALAKLATALPAAFPVPVLVVQHMAVGFTAGLVAWLDRQAAAPGPAGHRGNAGRARHLVRARRRTHDRGQAAR